MVKRYALDFRRAEMFEIASGYYVTHADYATLESENAKLRDLLRGEAAVAEECAKIAEEWGNRIASKIRSRFGGKA